jgi:tetratricopeptide (TPR) repeat protein
LNYIRNKAISKKTEDKITATEEYQKVIDTLTQAYASNGQLNRDLGRSFMQKNQYKVALKYLTTARDIRSEDAMIYYWLGVCNANLFKIEQDAEYLVEAEKNYLICLNLKPDGKEFLYAYAQLLVFGSGDYNKAVEILTVLIYQLKANDANAYFLLGRAYFMQSEFDKAYNVYNELYQIKKQLNLDKEQAAKLDEFLETTRQRLQNE